MTLDKQSNRVRKIRKKLMLSKAELARKAEVTVQTLDRIENGNECRLKTKRKIILALGYQLAEASRIFAPDSTQPLQGKIRSLRDSPSDAEAIHSEAPHPVHVLQVDDSESQRVLLQTILSGSPCKLDTAENGEVGFNKFVAGNYDLVFMDMQMPVMDGCTATRKIRAWEKENHQAPTPIIAMTANALASDREKCFKEGCSDYMVKPVPQEKLIQMIDNLAESTANTGQ